MTHETESMARTEQFDAILDAAWTDSLGALLADVRTRDARAVLIALATEPLATHRLLPAMTALAGVSERDILSTRNCTRRDAWHDTYRWRALQRIARTPLVIRTLALAMIHDGLRRVGLDMDVRSQPPSAGQRREIINPADLAAYAAGDRVEYAMWVGIVTRVGPDGVWGVVTEDYAPGAPEGGEFALFPAE